MKKGRVAVCTVMILLCLSLGKGCVMSGVIAVSCVVMILLCLSLGKGCVSRVIIV